MKKLLATITAALSLTALSACSTSGDETSALPPACDELSAEIVEEINFTLEAYENNESITSGKITSVQMEGAGTIPWDALIAARLNQAGTVGLWAYSNTGVITPLNPEAISAMPDAAVTNSEAVTQALNSSEGQATIQCVQ